MGVTQEGSGFTGDENGAGTTLAMAAAVFGAGKLKVLAENVEQGGRSGSVVTVWSFPFTEKVKALSIFLLPKEKST